MYSTAAKRLTAHYGSCLGFGSQRKSTLPSSPETTTEDKQSGNVGRTTYLNTHSLLYHNNINWRDSWLRESNFRLLLIRNSPASDRRRNTLIMTFSNRLQIRINFEVNN